MNEKTRTYGIAFAFSLLMILLATACSDPKREQKAIHKTWDMYSQYMYQSMGEECLRYLDSGSVHYYQEVLSLIINADSVTTDRLRFDKKILVLAIRLRVPRDKVLKMDGNALYVYCVHTGILSAKDNHNVFLSIKFIKNDTAMAQLVDSNKVPGLPLEFHKEHNEWKVDLTSVSGEFADKTWQEMVNQSGTTDRILLYDLLSVMSKRKPDNTIWHPMK